MRVSLVWVPKNRGGHRAGLRESLLLLLESDDKVLIPLCLKRKSVFKWRSSFISVYLTVSVLVAGGTWDLVFVVVIFVATLEVFTCWHARSLVVACRIQFPDQGSNPGPLHWDRGVLATRPPGMSPAIIYLGRGYPKKTKNSSEAQSCL